MRILQKDLEAVANRINEMTNNPLTAYTKVKGKLKANIGHYYIDGAYGGTKLVQMVNDGGAIRCITDGYNTKKETYYLAQAYINGLYDAVTKDS